MMYPAGSMPPPPFARGPHAPPPIPPAEPWVRELLRRQVERTISAPSMLALAIISVAMFWLPPIGVLFGLGVVIVRRYQLRLIDYYAAYFEPHGFLDRGTIQAGYVLGIIGLTLSLLVSAGWVFLIVTASL